MENENYTFGPDSLRVTYFNLIREYDSNSLPRVEVFRKRLEAEHKTLESKYDEGTLYIITLIKTRLAKKAINGKDNAKIILTKNTFNYYEPNLKDIEDHFKNYHNIEVTYEIGDDPRFITLHVNLHFKNITQLSEFK